jgi:hypothetical protein
MMLRQGLLSVVVLGLAACATPPPVRVPGSPNPAWSSYLVGEDIRGTCRQGGADHVRLVLNAVHLQRLRTFEVRDDGNGAIVETRIVTTADLPTFTDAGPWVGAGGRAETLRLTPAQMANFLERIAVTSGFRTPPPGAFLPTGGFYWLVSGCHQGQYFLSVFDWPADRFQTTAAPDPPAPRAGPGDPTDS